MKELVGSRCLMDCHVEKTLDGVGRVVKKADRDVKEVEKVLVEYHTVNKSNMAAYSKHSLKWEIRKIDALQTCLSTNVSPDHTNLDSNQIASIVFHCVKTNPSIPIKSVISKISNRFGYSVSYQKAWNAKQKVLAKAFGDWEDLYNELPRWFEAVQQTNPGTIIKYISSPIVVKGQFDPFSYILERVFWAFGPCIQGFNYCKPIVQGNGTFLTRIYQGTLLTTLAQDETRNIFPLAFAIVEGETREALIWFFSILAALRSEQVRWEGEGLQSVYFIRHIASNFNKRFKNQDLKNRLLNMAYEVKQPIFNAKLSALRSHSSEVASWDRIPLQKWTQAYDGSSRFGHMTTNLAECMNSILK
ncbi:uncharacterized protein LOC114184659 [Vigna unguiculata]|uniref:uncharacterized protein LOC114184659 n=1 Tax=Vigna unguiculata TaxID=3917 RepID=UPI001015E5CF|nr:uncharacterized protein LOC114184659 [Vigna unguiculata]